MVRISHKFANDDKSFQARVGDIMVEPCGCEYKVISDGRPWAMTPEKVCPDCNLRNEVAAANAVKEQSRMRIVQRLHEIDVEAGPRTVREIMISDGKKGFNNKIETLENEAVQLRAQLAAL